RWSEVSLDETPGGREAAEAARRVLLSRQVDRLRDWNQGQSHWSEAWRDAAFSTDMLLTLTPNELRQLGDEINDVIHHWVEKSKQQQPTNGSRARKGRRQIFFFAHAFPLEEEVGNPRRRR